MLGHCELGFTYQQSQLVGTNDEPSNASMNKFRLQNGNDCKFHTNVYVSDDTTHQHLIPRMRSDKECGGKQCPQTHDKHGNSTTILLADQVTGDQAKGEANVVETVEEGQEIWFDRICFFRCIVGSELHVEEYHGLSIAKSALLCAKVDLGQRNQTNREEQSAVKGAGDSAKALLWQLNLGGLHCGELKVSQRIGRSAWSIFVSLPRPRVPDFIFMSQVREV